MQFLCGFDNIELRKKFILERLSSGIFTFEDENIALESLSLDGFIQVPDAPGLGIESLNDEVIREHLSPEEKELWPPTDEWDEDYSHDRLWS